MAKNQQWSFVYEYARQALKKYFHREITGSVYIRILTKSRGSNFVQYFQMSGDEVGFNSIVIHDDWMERDIKRDFPFVKEMSIHTI